MYSYQQRKPRNLQQIEQDLTVNKNVAGALEDLGTLLRDATTRSSPAVTDLIPRVLSHMQDEEHAALRVLINFTADNVANRRFLLSAEPQLVEFWQTQVEKEPVEVDHSESVEGEEESRYFMTLVSQFIFSVDEEEEVEFLQKLIERKVIPWVFSYHGILGCTKDGKRELSGPLDFLIEYAKHFPHLVTSSQFNAMTGGYMNAIDPNTDYKDSGLFLMHAEFLFHCTNVEDSDKNFNIEELQHLFFEVDNECEDRVDILRKLFATCGHVYSYPSHDNWQHLSEKVRQLMGEWSFSIATGAISLGNCVSSKETQDELIRRISSVEPIEKVAQKVFRHHFEDVVYYQAYHFFNNIMNREIAAVLLAPANADAFYTNTKVIVDNFPYYKEVGQLYMKFLRRLVTFGLIEGAADPAAFNDAWLYLLNTDESESAEVLSLLSQAYSQRRDASASSGVQKALMGKVLELGSSIDIGALLSKIKTVSVFLKSYSVDEIRAIYGAEFAGGFLSQTERLIAELEKVNRTAAEQTLPAASVQASAHQALTNNSRFLALLVQQSLQPVRAEFGEVYDSISQTAARIIAGGK